MHVPPQGPFLRNCPEVEFGFFGSLVVFSKTAFSNLLAYDFFSLSWADSCAAKAAN